MPSYHAQRVERKWQRYWEKAGVNRAADFDSRPKFYGLVEFPYPSGAGLHVGHPRSYVAMDIIARQRRMRGYNVLFPIGFDAFGLPAEQYAVKTNTHPKVTTAKNIKTFTRQLKALGLSFDWSRAFSTTDPAYYRWTQWIFLQLYRHGLAYRAEMPIHWCPRCRIGLANEEVREGRCERCGGAVEERTKAQWMLRITRYAQRLIDDLALVDYPEHVRRSQLNWIGRSEGATIKFQVASCKLQIEVFTTRPDTIFGATYLVVSPEHSLITNDELRIANYGTVKEYAETAKRKSDRERTAVGREKTGVKLEGIFAVNPATGQPIPIFVADYVLASYGTGAIMAVPAHDQRDYEFAKKYGRSMIEVIAPVEKIRPAQSAVHQPMAGAYEATDGILVNSGQFNGLPTAEGAKKIVDWLQDQGVARWSVNYKLRDWVFSRQRYWGEPIPIVYCASLACRNRRLAEGRTEAGVHAVVLDGREYSVVPVPDDQLPVTLPAVKKFQPTPDGQSPLESSRWTRVRCPQCGERARRETDVMPNWAGSNWYYLAYAMRGISNFQFPVSQYADVLKYWMPVDWYNGGMEHTTLHLLYSRFIYKFLWDIGAVPKACGPEPYRKRTSHGLILGQGGEKMSKSRGNVVNPDEVITAFGADVLRLYEMFIGPFEQAAPWDPRSIVGIKRFVASVFNLAHDWRAAARKPASGAAGLETQLQHAIRKVGDDIEAMRFNTAIAQLMMLRHALGAQPAAVTQSQLERFLTLLAPFAPHLAEEAWAILGRRQSIFLESWPAYDAGKAQTLTVTVVVQVNGKVRGRLAVAPGEVEAVIVRQARQLPAARRYLQNATNVRVVYVKERLVNFVTKS